MELEPQDKKQNDHYKDGQDKDDGLRLQVAKAYLVEIKIVEA